jgi:peptidoglycan hydrolase-like protein with peptidoglycan-binding domain
MQKARGLDASGIADPLTIATAYAPKVAPVKPPIVSSPSVATALPPLNVNPASWRAVMKQGNEGKDVGEWQMILLRDGYKPTVDGRFGAETETMTKGWQTEHGLTPDGKVGNDVKAVLSAQTKLLQVVAGDLSMVMGRPAPLAPPSFIMMNAGDAAIGRTDSLAVRLSEHLRGAQSGTEDRELVSEFQRLVGLNDTGAYGPATGQALMTFGVVPPHPYYWPTKKIYRAQSRYKAALREQAQRDPSRAAEWIRASNV